MSWTSNKLISRKPQKNITDCSDSKDINAAELVTKWEIERWGSKKNQIETITEHKVSMITRERVFEGTIGVIELRNRCRLQQPFEAGIFNYVLPSEIVSSPCPADSSRYYFD